MATGTNVTPVKITAVAIVYLNIEISFLSLARRAVWRFNALEMERCRSFSDTIAPKDRNAVGTTENSNVYSKTRPHARKRLLESDILRLCSRAVQHGRADLKSERDLEHRDDGLAPFGVVDELQSDVGFVCSKDEFF